MWIVHRVLLAFSTTLCSGFLILTIKLDESPNSNIGSRGGWIEKSWLTLYTLWACLVTRFFSSALSPAFYISSTIPGLNSWLIEISFVTTTLLEMTALLGPTNSLRMTTSPTILFYLDTRYSNILAFVAALIHALDMLTCSGGFSDFLRPCSIGVGVAKNANVMSTYVKSASYVGNVSVIGACTGIAYIGNSCIRATCIRDTGAINCLGIYS